MAEISAKTYQWAMDCFESAVEELLDDPSGLLHPWRELEPAEEIAQWRERGADLGLDFDALVEKHGSDYEKKRLRDIESGVIPPAPADPIERDRLKTAVETEVARRMPQELDIEQEFVDFAALAKILPNPLRDAQLKGDDREASDDGIGSELTNWMPPQT